MNPILDQNEDLLYVGALHANDTQKLCNDVAAVIFPTAIAAPTEATISAVTSKLVQLVTDVEQRLLGEGQSPPQLAATWPLLAQSGFLREPDLVDFVLARVAEDRLEVRIESVNAALTSQLLDHSDVRVADAAQILLASDSLHRRSKGNSFLALPAELLHKLCWRVVAALEILHEVRSPAIITAARDILACYDEGHTIAAAAQKVVHFIAEAEQDKLLQPEIAGLHLFVGALASRLNLDHDHILRLIDAGSAAPFAVILRAMATPKDKAMSSIVLLRSAALTRREVGIFNKGYDALDPFAASKALAEWAFSRSQFLAFGQS